MPAAGQSDCVLAPGGKYVRAQTFYSSPIAAYSDSGCANRSGTVGVGAFGWVHLEHGRSVAEQICQGIHADEEDMRASALSAPNFYRCTVGGGGGSGGSGARGGRTASQGQAPELNLSPEGLRFRAFDGMEQGIQFRRLSAYYVGNQAALDMGFLDAVDVWGAIGSGYEVCFPQVGRIVFLDAATSPRSLVAVEHSHVDPGYSCASLDRAGTLVLVQQTDGAAAATTTSASDSAVTRPGTRDPLNSAIELEDCVVAPRLNLRLRRNPWGAIRRVVPRGTQLSVFSRTRNWYRVTYDEVFGWVAAWHVAASAGCAYDPPE